MKPSTEEGCGLEELTVLAMEAAEQGQWDAVARLYDCRAKVGDWSSVSPDLAKKLMETDCWIMARIQEVKNLIQAQLREVQQQRRGLEGLKRQWAPLRPEAALHRLSI